MSLRSDVLLQLINASPNTRIKICASITSISIRDLKGRVLSAVEDGADFVEIRLDYLKRIDTKLVREAIEGLHGKMILTCRRRDEGGMFAGKERERMRIISELIEWDWAVKDVELRTAMEHPELIDGSKDLILSWHDFKTTPRKEHLKQKIESAREFGGIAKVVTTANSIKDNTMVLSLYNDQPRGTMIAFCMGEKGVLSRILAPLLGSPLTYAYHGREAVSPGQISLAELKELYGIMGFGA